MINIPYNPILHDLSTSPRNMNAFEVVEYWLGRILQIQFFDGVI